MIYCNPFLHCDFNSIFLQKKIEHIFILQNNNKNPHYHIIQYQYQYQDQDQDNDNQSFSRFN
jgi:hypothetical protein